MLTGAGNDIHHAHIARLIWNSQSLDQMSSGGKGTCLVGLRPQTAHEAARYQDSYKRRLA